MNLSAFLETLEAILPLLPDSVDPKHRTRYMQLVELLRALSKIRR